MGRTACNTQVVKEIDNLRWLGPPSFPLTELGRTLSSISEPDENTEQDKLQKDRSSSCMQNRTSM